MMFCLDDGAELLYGPASDDPATEIFPVPSAMVAGSSSGEAATALFLSSSGSRIDIANSIAVLPFAHLSSDPDDEYFCDGLAEELLNALSRIDGLKVAARTSSFS